jgi:stalled ribosome rescue protein Dom34
MSKPHYHAVIWIDHREARVFHFNSIDVKRLVLHPDNPTKHIHHKANSIGSGHASPDHDYLQAVTKSVADAGTVLITGPANAKNELADHVRLHDPGQAKTIASGTRRNDISEQMRNIARQMTPDEIIKAANYYAAQP